MAYMDIDSAATAADTAGRLLPARKEEEEARKLNADVAPKEWQIKMNKKGQKERYKYFIE
jgi:hypothetical protein